MQIEVIEDCEGDEPTECVVDSAEMNEKRRRQHIRNEAEKLGWKIDESGGE